ncbi:MAG: GNAT family N-acetyltransferase [Solirubrobacteraceae bacterium]
MPAPSPTLTTADPASALGQRTLRAYMEDVVSRYWRRQATSGEVDRAMREDPSDDLTGETGLFVVAVVDGEPVGCGGVRFKADGIAELTRMWVAPHIRRRGLAARIVAHLEHQAVARDRTRMRLDTRSDLAEARALYARLGYREVAPFNDGPYSEHWFEKAL